MCSFHACKHFADRNTSVVLRVGNVKAESYRVAVLKTLLEDCARQTGLQGFLMHLEPRNLWVQLAVPIWSLFSVVVLVSLASGYRLTFEDRLILVIPCR